MRSGRVRIDRVYGHESAGGSATPAGPGVSLTFLRRLETAMSAISTMRSRVDLGRDLEHAASFSQIPTG